ncbi:hypothetical protein DICPUDRAFT_75581 [Dictyostelium purpureum]|uniref:Uncharacterized protein n=1 Tax=Dictyostelium purpureum TaxID=5786 RepID=F0ZB26_DICPU|nr:uncharacterized protein DICPUDRAFT_75581 [Dictyostelium purpureum]EGC38843.1 hypothetical protein DICPUDRAFT_75581 [Dictyostelium purpureum]|eukprot:XP_003284637.1 hypothetical protein DICPUDRAFT_75581 [Dictyostelium purpureum]
MSSYNHFIEYQKQFSCPTIGHLTNDQLLLKNNETNNNNNFNDNINDLNTQWRFSFPLDHHLNSGNFKPNQQQNNQTLQQHQQQPNNKIKYWKNGIIPLNSNSFKSCPNLLNSYSKHNLNKYNSDLSITNSIKVLDDLLEPRPARKNTKIEEMVKGRIKERLGKLLNNELMEKQGKAIGKAASTYEDNILKSKERAKKYILLSQSNSNLSSVIIVN